MALPWISAGWKTQLQTGFPSADRFYIDFRGYDYPAVYDTMTYTPITSGTQWCGYSNATGGYAQYLIDMPTKFVVDIRAKANFAFDVGVSQYLFGWYYNANNLFYIRYSEPGHQIVVAWIQAGASVFLASAVLTAITLAAVNRITVVVDSTTGSASGSALYLNGASVHTSWSGNITARAVRVAVLNLRAQGAVGAGLTAGLWNVNTVRLFPGVTATPAQVLANFSTVYTEELVWYLNSCSLGHSRVNVSRFVTNRFCERLVTDPDTGNFKANRLTLDLLSHHGEFADDQYAAWDPANAVYNGLSTQAYMRKRCRVLAETWYGDDFECYFTGRVENGFERNTAPGDVSRVSITAVDQIAELGMRHLRRGRFYEDLYLTSATEADSLLHLFARLGSQREVYNYASNSSFENATIGNSWTVSGGVQSRQADALVGGFCGQLVNATGSVQTWDQEIRFTGTKKLNVGETYCFLVWLKSAGATTEDIQLSEYDAGGVNGTTGATYALAGGEGWVAFYTTRTITDSASDRLIIRTRVPNGATLKLECAGLYQMGRAPEWFVLNADDGAAGVYSADNAELGTYDTHGFAVDVVNIQHPWARVEPGGTPWGHIKQLAVSSLAYKCGYNECGVFVFRAILATGFADPASVETLTAPMSMVTVLNMNRANRIVVRGIYITKSAASRLVWIASTCGSFVIQGDARLLEVIADGDSWPPPATFGEFKALYDTSTFVVGIPGGTKNPDLKASSGNLEVIGLKSPRLNQSILGGAANHLVVTTLDTTTYADGAVVLLTNSSGSSRTLYDLGLMGLLVFCNRGNTGFVHDAFVDWDRVAIEGDNVLEIANDYIVTKAQVEAIADWQWKFCAGIKHQYRLTKPGAWYHLEPGDTVTLTFGGAGQEENINSVCRVVSVQNEGGSGALGTSTIVLNEIMQGWVKDSNAVARHVAGGRMELKG